MNDAHTIASTSATKVELNQRSQIWEIPSHRDAMVDYFWDTDDWWKKFFNVKPGASSALRLAQETIESFEDNRFFALCSASGAADIQTNEDDDDQSSDDDQIIDHQ